jgi:hypothetical protein
VKGSCPGVLLAAATRLALAPFTCSTGACCSAGVLTGGADAEEGADPPAAGVDDDPSFPGVVPDEPGFVVVSGVVVIVSTVVVVSGVDSVVVVV